MPLLLFRVGVIRVSPAPIPSLPGAALPLQPLKHPLSSHLKKKIKILMARRKVAPRPHPLPVKSTIKKSYPPPEYVEVNFMRSTILIIIIIM